jgi:hypothetical protein
MNKVGPEGTKKTRAVMLKLSPAEHCALVVAATKHGLRATDFVKATVRLAIGYPPLEPRSRGPSNP